MKITKILIILSLIITSHCGFKVLDKSQKNNFIIKDITTSGENRINYKIRNNILAKNNSASRNFLSIDLKTKKIKIVKEKNTNNKINKYEISLQSEVIISKIGYENKISFSKLVSGDFIVAENYSSTMVNEKKLTDNLADQLSEVILDEIALKLDDL